MKLRLLLTLLFILALRGELSAQWQQTSGPYGQAVSSFVKTDNGMLAVMGNGLYRYEQNSWKLVQDEWWGELKRAGNVILSAHVSRASRSTDGGMHWSAVTLPSDAVTVIGDKFFATSGDSLLTSSDGASWSFLHALPEQSSGMVEHHGKLFTSSGFNGLLRSDDTGRTWKPLPQETPFSMVVKWYSSDDALYALPYPSGIFRSTDDGATWQDMHFNLYEGTVFEGVAAHGSEIFASDWNTTYQLVNDQWVVSPIAKIHTSAVVHGELYVANEAGLASFKDAKFSWMNGGAISPNVTALASTGNSLFARTATGLFRSQDAGKSWQFNSAAYATDIATTSNAVVVLGTTLMRSTNEGNTWEDLSNFMQKELIAPTKLAASNDVLYLSSGLVSSGEHGSGARWTTGGIYRSTDHGATWSDISANLPTNGITTVPVYSVAATSHHIVLQTAAGIFVSLTNQISWYKVEISAKGHYAQNIYSFGPAFLMQLDSTWYLSYDGEAYSELEVPAPEGFMSDYAYVTSFSAVRGVPYLTTSKMIKVDSIYTPQTRNYRLGDNAWEDITATLPENTLTLPLIEHKGEIYAGTSSRGVWKMGLPAAVAPENERAEMAVYPNPATTFINVSGLNAQVIDALGRDVTRMTTVNTGRLEISALPSGAYTIVTDEGSAHFIKH